MSIAELGPLTLYTAEEQMVTIDINMPIDKKMIPFRRKLIALCLHQLASKE
jgi:hypothetical protein